MPDGANVFEIKPAVRENTAAFVALAGPSGSGKTRSALELATGLAGPTGKILVADTEGKRSLHYADIYKFDRVGWLPPFTPERNAELIDLAERGGYSVLVIDSQSDEFEGEGGLQEIRDATKDEFWARTKARHKHALINRMRRAKVHLIFCLRAEERVRISKVYNERRGKEETVIEPLGWQPICEKRFLYEVQSSFLFDPARPGIPQPIKLYDIHSKFFPADKPVNRSAGEALAKWCAGGIAPSDPEIAIVNPTEPFAPDTGEVLDAATLAREARSAAAQGTDAFREHLRGLSREARAILNGKVGTKDAPGELLTLALRTDEGLRSAPPDEQTDVFGLPPLGEPIHSPSGTNQPHTPGKDAVGGTDRTAPGPSNTQPDGDATMDDMLGGPARPAVRDESWWNREQLNIAARNNTEFQTLMHQRVREARNWAEIERLRDDNPAIDNLDKATKQDVLGALADREKVLRANA